MDILCKYLYETYNTTILDLISPPIRDAFEKIAEHYTKNNTDRQALIELIINHKNNQKPMTQLLGGPHVVYVYRSLKYDMLIYILGERHGQVMDCKKSLKGKQFMPIEEYMSKLYTNSDVFIDFFYETPKFEGAWVSLPWFGKNRLHRINDKFNECLQTLTRHQKKCRLGRVHYLDIRKFSTRPPSPETGTFYLRYHGRQNTYNAEVTKILKTIKEEGLISYVRDLILKIKEVKKEVDRSYLGNDILKFYKKHIMKVCAKQEENIQKQIDKYLKPKQSAVNKNKALKTISTHLVDINASIVDIYAVSRVFKVFNIKKSPYWKKQFSQPDQPPRPHNVVMYTGAAHSRRYISLLEHLGFEKIEESIDTKFEHCVDISNITQPFFSSSIMPNRVVMDKYKVKTVKVHKIPKVIAKPTVFGGLYNIGQSCYLDSTLMALLAVPNKFVTDNILNGNMFFVGNLRQCGNTPGQDMVNKRKIQKYINDLAQSIRGEKTINYCTNFRKLLANCDQPSDQPFDLPEQRDAGEFIQWLFTLFPVNKCTKRFTNYVTDDVSSSVFDIDFSTLVKSSERTDDNSSVIQTINAFNLFILAEEKIINTTDLLKIIEDSGELSDNNMAKVGNLRYKRSIRVEEIVSTPYLILYVQRNLPNGPLRSRIDATERIIINNKTLELSAFVTHAGEDDSGHYTCYFKYRSDWYFYNDTAGTRLVSKIGNYNVMIETTNVLRNSVLIFYV